MNPTLSVDATAADYIDDVAAARTIETRPGLASNPIRSEEWIEFHPYGQNPILSPVTSQRPQEIQQILFLRFGEMVERIDHAVRFGALACMCLDRGQQAAIGRRRAPIVQKEDALTDAP